MVIVKYIFLGVRVGNFELPFAIAKKIIVPMVNEWKKKMVYNL